MVKDILQIGNPILTKTTTLVEDLNSKEIKQIITDLLDTCNSNKAGTAGLAAPQIGYGKQICICRRTDLEDELKEDEFLKDNELWEVLINPKIIFKSEEASTIWEACLSIGSGNDGLWGPVTRPAEITVEFTTPQGEIKQLKGKDFFSHVIQHELDHLDGILFLSYISNPANIWKRKDLDEYLDQHDQYPLTD